MRAPNPQPWFRPALARAGLAPLAPALLLAAALLLPACPASNGNGDAGVGADPPQVTVTLLDTNKVGTSFKLTVLVSGCDPVKRLSLFDHDTYLTDVNYTPGGTIVDLKPNQVPYIRGIAAPLQLTAKVECSDGRTNTSAPQPGSFFPVESVVTPSVGGLVVPSAFIAEGTGDNTFFYGCGQDPSGRYLVKVAVGGNPIATARNLPVLCSESSVFTEKSPVTRKRWMLEPGAGILEFDSNLAITTAVAGNFTGIGLAPDGDVVVWVSDPSGGRVARYPHNGGTAAAPRWDVNVGGTVDGSIGKQLAGGPQINPDGTVTVTYYNAGTGTGSFSSEKLDYRNGVLASLYPLKTVAYSGTTPPAALSPTGTLVYVPNETSGGNTVIVACATNAPSCTDPGVLRWTSAPLSGVALLILPFAQGSELAVVTTRQTYFLRTSDGVTSPTVLGPSGTLTPLFVQQGLGRDFYLFNGIGGVATEVVAVDAEDVGELFRFTLTNTLGGGLSGAVADDGVLWLRINSDLVKPLANLQYRRGRSNQ